MDKTSYTNQPAAAAADSPLTSPLGGTKGLAVGSALTTQKIPWGSVLRERLSRKLLMKLPAGAFVVSNGYRPFGGRLFAEPVGTPESRDAQWARIRTAGAAGRLCYVIWSAAHFAAMNGNWGASQ